MVSESCGGGAAAGRVAPFGAESVTALQMGAAAVAAAEHAPELPGETESSSSSTSLRLGLEDALPSHTYSLPRFFFPSQKNFLSSAAPRACVLNPRLFITPN